MASTFGASFGADRTPLSVCPEDGNMEDYKASIKAEILTQLAPVKNRADDLVNVLRIRRSHLEGLPPYKLDHVIDKWLDEAYDTKKYGLPCWDSLIVAVADANGGANKALAKRLAGIYKAGVYSVEPSHVIPTMAQPEEESVNRPTSPPVPNVPPTNNNIPHPSSGPPRPQGHVPPSVPPGALITKPLAESSGEETCINTNSSGSSYSGGSSTSGSTIPSSIQNAISSSSSSSSSGASTAPTSAVVMCTEMSSNQSAAGTSPSNNNSSCGASTGISNSSFGITGTSNNSSYGGASTGTSDNSSYGGASTGTSNNSSYGGASTGTSYGSSTGTNPNIINSEPPVVDKSEMKQSPYHGGQGYLGGDDNDFQQEASDYDQSTAMVTPSNTDSDESRVTESEVADDGHGFLSSLGKKTSVVTMGKKSDNKLPPGLLAYDMAKGDHHGYALIINNIRIDGREERLGANLDGDNLSKTLQGLKYKLVGNKVHENCTAYRIQELFNEAMKEDHTQYDSFICCILSHGDSDFVFGTDDKKVWLNDLQKKVIQCPSLVGKPKVFFIQACRGGELPDARRVQVDDEGVQVGKILLPEACDVFFGYATSPNTKACRFTNAGSWYIIELCKAMREFPHEDLMTIVQIAQYKVSTHRDYVYVRQENGVERAYRQSPQLVSTLIKKLYFNRLL